MNGELESLIKEPTFERHLPAIPDRVNTVNFTWRAGDQKGYEYEFLNLESSNLAILHPPTLSIPLRGKVPKKTKGSCPYSLFSLQPFNWLDLTIEIFRSVLYRPGVRCQCFGYGGSESGFFLTA